jgi:hypothetical protein
MFELKVGTVGDLIGTQSLKTGVSNFAAIICRAVEDRVVARRGPLNTATWADCG